MELIDLLWQTISADRVVLSATAGVLLCGAGLLVLAVLGRVRPEPAPAFVPGLSTSVMHIQRQPVSAEDVRRLLARGRTTTQVARQTGLAHDALSLLARDLPHDRQTRPSEAQIAARAKAS